MPNSHKKLFSPSFIIICLANFFMYISFHMLMPVLPLYLLKGLHFEATAVGIILAAYVASAMAIRPFAGFLSDSYKGKKLLIATFIFFALCNIGYLSTTNLYMLFFVRILHGLAFGFVTTAAVVYAIEVIPKEKLGTGIGIFGASSALSMSLAPMCGVFILEFTDYLTVFKACIGFSSLSCLIIFFARALPPVPLNERPGFSFSEFLVPSVKYAFLGYCGITFLYGMLTNYASLFIVNHNFTMNAGYFFAFFAGGMIITRLGGGKFIDKGHTVPTILLGKGGVVLGLCLFLYAPSEWIICTAAILLGLGFGLLIPAMQTLFTLLAPANQRGRANSLFYTAFDAGIGVALMVSGVLIKTFSLQTAYLVALCIFLLSTLFFCKIVVPHYHKNKIPL